MDVKSIDNSLVSLNNTSNQQKVSGKANTSAIHNEKDSSFSLIINDYNKKRDELSSSLQATNNGIGKSKIAQIGLQKEQVSLGNIQEKINSLDVNDQSDNNSIKNSLNKELLTFRQHAYDTKYARENLIAIDDYEENLTIEVSTRDAYFSIDKPNTPVIASNVAQVISKSDLNTSDGIQNSLESVGNAIQELQTIESQFREFDANLEASARQSIKDQINLSNENLKNKKLNFQDETNSFSKDNVKSVSGYLVATQANIVQDQSSKLLG